MNQDSNNYTEIKRPSVFWLLTEGGRALTEMGLSLPYRRFANEDHHSDGHPVLVIPGFMAGPSSTAPLRRFISKIGYTALDWGLGRNYAKEQYIATLQQKLDRLYNKSNEHVTIIGWSLGGVYARQIAKSRPNLVRQVITMGSPFQGITQPNNVAWIYRLISGGKRTSDIQKQLLQDIPEPAPVPTTAIFSKQDGIVPWALCKEEEGSDIHQNIEVKGSHLGLGVNISVLSVIANRLRFKKHEWEPFIGEQNSDELSISPAYGY